jgi:hypothetical protein
MIIGLQSPALTPVLLQRTISQPSPVYSLALIASGNAWETRFIARSLIIIIFIFLCTSAEIMIFMIGLLFFIQVITELLSPI